MTPAEFRTWLGTAGVESVEYHRGHLAQDRTGKTAAATVTDQIGTAAMQAAEAGQVALVQRREGDGYAYLAQRVRHRAAGQAGAG